MGIHGKAPLRLDTQNSTAGGNLRSREAALCIIHV
jgi:hypothetical protein